MSSVPESQTMINPMKVFWTFFRVSALTIGGGYAMVPVIGREVTNKRWMEEREFYDLFAVAQSFPGPIALTTAMVVGRRVAGIAGFALAILGVLIPPFVSVILVALLLDGFGDLAPVRAFLDGASAVIPDWWPPCFGACARIESGRHGESPALWSRSSSSRYSGPGPFRSSSPPFSWPFSGSVQHEPSQPGMGFL
jgi:hypothetical protein